jgi:hypothetical protein
MVYFLCSNNTLIRENLAECVCLNENERVYYFIFYKVWPTFCTRVILFFIIDIAKA